MEQNHLKILLNADYYSKPLYELAVMRKHGQMSLSWERDLSRFEPFEPGETVAPVFYLSPLTLALNVMSGK